MREEAGSRQWQLRAQQLRKTDDCDWRYRDLIYVI